MHTRQLVGLLAEKTSAKTYLEIGVAAGKTISRIQIQNRIGVDPAPKLLFKIKMDRWLRKNHFKLFRMTSDRFFQHHAETVLTSGLDVVFVDGLHTYRQALQDVRNSLKYLNDNGVIIMHDCNPISALHGYPVQYSIEERHAARRKQTHLNWPRAWNGDVWKAVWHLRCEEPSLTIFTLNCDHGLGIVMKKKTEITYLDPDIADINMIEKSDYAFFDLHRERILNLKNEGYIDNILQYFTT